MKANEIRRLIKEFGYTVKCGSKVLHADAPKGLKWQAEAWKFVNNNLVRFTGYGATMKEALEDLLQKIPLF